MGKCTVEVVILRGSPLDFDEVVDFGSGTGSGFGDDFGDDFSFGSSTGDGFGDDFSFHNDFGFNFGAGIGTGTGDGLGSGFGEDSQGFRIWQAYCPEVDSCSRDVTLALWKSRTDGGPANGGKANFTAAPGLIQEIEGPLLLCTGGSLHATLNPLAWGGERLWLVALHGEVEVVKNKLGALKREIIREIPLKKNKPQNSIGKIKK